jgi:hypothetical protein
MAEYLDENDQMINFAYTDISTTALLLWEWVTGKHNNKIINKDGNHEWLMYMEYLDINNQ